MFKRLSILIISLNFILVRCSNYNNNDEVQEKNQIKIKTSYKENIDNSKKIIFSGKTITPTKYLTLGNLLFFPDLNNNNKLSVATLPKTSGIIDSNLIIDSFHFNLISLVSDENYIYFSSTSPEKGFYRLNYEKREITKLNSYSPIYLIDENERVSYVDSNDNNYIYSIDINNFQIKKVLNLSTSSLKQNSNNTYFINNEDPSSIYKRLLDKEDSKYEYTKVFSNSANQYFVTDLGIFIETANNSESIYFIKEN